MSRRAKWHARVRFRLEPELGSWPKPHARVPFRFRPEMAGNPGSLNQNIKYGPISHTV